MVNCGPLVAYIYGVLPFLVKCFGKISLNVTYKYIEGNVILLTGCNLIINKIIDARGYSNSYLFVERFVSKHYRVGELY